MKNLIENLDNKAIYTALHSNHFEPTKFNIVKLNTLEMKLTINNFAKFKRPFIIVNKYKDKWYLTKNGIESISLFGCNCEYYYRKSDLHRMFVELNKATNFYYVLTDFQIAYKKRDEFAPDNFSRLKLINNSYYFNNKRYKQNYTEYIAMKTNEFTDKSGYNIVKLKFDLNERLNNFKINNNLKQAELYARVHFENDLNKLLHLQNETTKIITASLKKDFKETISQLSGYYRLYDLNDLRNIQFRSVAHYKYVFTENIAIFDKIKSKLSNIL